MTAVPAMYRDTDYAEERARTVMGEIRLERLYVKSEEQEEIRLSWWPDGRMANRPVDIPESMFVDIIAQGIRDGVLSPLFLAKLIAKTSQIG